MRQILWTILFVVPVLLFGQQKQEHTPTSQKWTQVEKLLAVKNYQQTLPILADIKAAALKNKNNGEWMRACFVEMKTLQVNSTERKNFEKTLYYLEDHIKQLETPYKEVMTNIYALFLQINIDRNEAGSKNWYIKLDQQKKKQLIDSIFRESLLPKDQLLAEPIEKWTTMFEDPKTQALVPTLYHFLASNYIEFQQENSKDNTALEQLSKTIIDYNVQHNLHDATAYLKRLQLKQYPLIYSPFNTANVSKWLEAVNSTNSDYNAYLLYEVAEYYSRRQKKDTAMVYLGHALQEYPNAHWIDHAKYLSEDIKAAHIELQTSQFAPAEQFTPLQLTTTNVDTLYIKVYNTTRTLAKQTAVQVKFDSLRQRSRIDAPLVYEEFKVLPHQKDYQRHRTLYKLNALKAGHYTVFISNNKLAKNDGLYNETAISSLYVSDVFVTATLEKKQENANSYKLQFIDRNTGVPYAGKKVELFKNSQRIKTVISNNKGECLVQLQGKRRDLNLAEYQLYIADEKQLIGLDALTGVENHAYQTEQQASGKPQEEINIVTMTDRKIYRPGQKVYFKNVVFDSQILNERVLEKRNMTVYLIDANQQKIDSVALVSNAFGSVNGEFDLPKKTLAGNFYIRTITTNGAEGNYHFRVEEYKRPTFNVTFEKNKKTYTHADTAVFTGKAESLSGVALSNATVNYTIDVKRNWSDKQLHIDSTLTTDQDGKFAIRLPLNLPLLDTLDDFSIDYSAEVVNQTGEMQASEGTYVFSTKPWQLAIQTETYMEAGRWKNLHILTQNKNAQPLPFTGKVNIYKLEEPTKIVTDDEQSLFRQVDYHLLNTEEYERYFPYLFDEMFLRDTPRKELVASYSFDTHDTTLVAIDSSLFDFGQFEIEAYTVQEGDSIRETQQVYLYEPTSKRVNKKTFLTYALDKTSYGIGDSVRLKFIVDLPDATNLFLYTARSNKKETILLPIKNNTATYQFVLSKTDILDPMNLSAVLVSHNMIDMQRFRIPTSRTDKRLTIKTATFRDKITPGKKEKWSFSVVQKDKAIEAEVMATMYDAALDVFASNSFPSSLSENYSPYKRWYYNQLDYYYLLSAFKQQKYGYDAFRNRELPKKLSNAFPILRAYGLPFGNEGKIGAQSLIGLVSGITAETAALDEVVVEGYQKRAYAPKEQMASTITVRGTSTQTDGVPLYIVDGQVVEKQIFEKLDPAQIAEISILKDGEATAVYGTRAANGVVIITTKEGKKAQERLNAAETRTNLQETAFFFPTLYTDKDGMVSFEFDSPEALTRWKLLLFAHSKQLEAGSADFFTQTQKQLMVRPNPPRFFREGDELLFKTQIQNISEQALKGDARLEIIDPATNKNISPLFTQDNAVQTFEVAANGNTLVAWRLKIPSEYTAVQIKVVAATDEFSDGEIHELAVLPNKVLVTDTKRIVLKPNQKENYSINTSGKDNVQANVQVQSNPIIEILSALDYLYAYPYACTEQTSSKWFGMQMVHYIDKHYPAVSRYFQSLDTASTLGRLESNSTLSELNAEEMPWLRNIQSEKEKLVRLAALFKANKQADIQAIEQKLRSIQLEDGAYPWFEGGKANREISIRILEITGKVYALDKSLISNDLKEAMQKLIRYLDTATSSSFINASKSMLIDYLYARRYWASVSILTDKQRTSYQKLLQESAKYTAKMPAGIAAKAWVVSQLYGSAQETEFLRNRILQEVIQDEEQGMYWESNQNSYNATSLQSYMLEAFKQNDTTKLNALTQWLYYKKNANNWQTTWMTVDAVYTLLLANDPKEFSLDNTVSIWVDGTVAKTDQQVLGQTSLVLPKEQLNGTKDIQIANNNHRIVYGGIYHQYFSPADKVQEQVNDIAVERKYFIKKGEKWIETTKAKLGEVIKVKLTVVNNKPLSYIHLKDSRPSGFEPVYQPSGYRWRFNCYFTMRDASTNYFFDYLPEGKIELEYEVKANNIGIFNAGICTLEGMYEPASNARAKNSVFTIEE